MKYAIYNDNMLNLNNLVEPNSVDSIITDPPYELNFMGKGWDNAGVSFQKETWKKCYDALKEGGYLLAFGGSRTFHRIACAIEDAGFEIRDTIMWLYGSGFPKSMNIGLALDKKNGIECKVVAEKQMHDFSTQKKSMMHFTTNENHKTSTTSIKVLEAQNEWQGWGTALKPSFEPIIVARKPFKGSLVDNIIKNGVGGINIDECRVGDEKVYSLTKDLSATHGNNWGAGTPTPLTGEKVEHTGRFPANTILTYDETDYEEVCGGFPNTSGGKRHNTAIRKSDKKCGYGYDLNTRNEYNDSGSASRYFYCAKASKKDRDEGLEQFEEKQKIFNGQSNESSKDIKDVEQRFTTQIRNIHPTVKPTQLMQYLVRLVTPKGGVILDPFNGSGSTGKAVAYENIERGANYSYIGIEQNKEYVDISKARIDYVINKMPLFKEVEEC